MTGRTHDLAAFTALNLVVATNSPSQLTLATALVGLTANLIGGLAPDIDQPTAELWNRLPAGSIFGRILSPILGGHRFISHSILGMIIFGLGSKYLLNLLAGVLLVDMQVVWICFMIGFVSHLLMDTLTREGVPWLFPLPVRLGVPPLRALRMKTGGLLEKMMVFPGLILANAYIYYRYYPQFMEFLRHTIRY